MNNRIKNAVSAIKNTSGTALKNIMGHTGTFNKKEKEKSDSSSSGRDESVKEDDEDLGSSHDSFDEDDNEEYDVPFTTWIIDEHKMKI
jgi:hypothetical protein